MRSCRTIVDQFLYRTCVDRNLDGFGDGELFDEVDDIEEKVRSIEGMLSELSSMGATEGDEIFTDLAGELDEARDSLKTARSRVAAQGFGSTGPTKRLDSGWIKVRNAAEGPQIRRSQKIAEQMMAQAGIKKGARVIAKSEPNAAYGVIWMVIDPHTDMMFYAVESPTEFGSSLVLFKKLLDDSGGHIRPRSLGPLTLERLLNRVGRAVPCPRCSAVAGSDCLRPSGHPIPYGKLHQERVKAFDRYAVKMDAKLGYTINRRGSPAMHGTPLSTEDYSETVSGPMGSVTLSARGGIGSVSVVRNNEYMGFMVWMKPSDFLALNQVRGNSPAWMEKQIRDGVKLGIPFLDVKPPDSWWDTRSKERMTFQVTGHEGRTRMRAVMAAVGDVPVPVAVMAPPTRARHWSPSNIAGATLMPDQKKSWGADNKTRRPFNIGKFALQGRLYQ